MSKHETVDHIPYRGNHRQRRRPLRSVILSHHRRIHDPVNTRNQRAAKSGAQILAIQRRYLAVQKFHFVFLLRTKKPDKEQTFQSVPYPAIAFLNNPPSEQSSRILSQIRRPLQFFAVCAILLPSSSVCVSPDRTDAYAAFFYQEVTKYGNIHSRHRTVRTADAPLCGSVYSLAAGGRSV